MKTDYPDIYKKYFVDKGDDRLGLFRILAEKSTSNPDYILVVLSIFHHLW